LDFKVIKTESKKNKDLLNFKITIYIMKYSRRSKTRKSKRKPRRKLKRKTRRKLKRNTRSKRRRRQQRIQSKQRGGMFINLSPKNIKNFQDNPHLIERDCCPCVFHFFGMPLDLVKDLRTRYSKTGMQSHHIINVFKKAYPETPKGRHISWEWHGSAPKPYQPSSAASAAVRPFLAHIYNELKNSQGVIGVTNWKAFDRRAGSHCIIFAKNASGKPLLIDAQHPGLSAVGEEAIIKYINIQGVWNVSVLSGKDADGQRITIDSSGNLVDDMARRRRMWRRPRRREQKRQDPLQANRDEKLNARRGRNHPLNTILHAISPPVG
jgi:hypothetical protein